MSHMKDTKAGDEVCVSVNAAEVRHLKRLHAVVVSIRHGWQYTIRLDDGTEHEVPVGHLHRWVTPETIELAKANAVEAGFEQTDEGWFARDWDTGARRGYHGQEFPLGLADEYGHHVRCAECNEPTSWSRRHCSTCGHWLGLINGDRSRAAVVDDQHYVIGTGTGPKDCRGFGGATFHLRFHDGREVTTSDLWSQGKIHPRFRDRLPANCEFINEGERLQWLM